MGLFLNMLRGFCMALADSVPGVSGGTIAFVLGFYDEFIGSLYFLTHGTAEQKKSGFRFLFKLGLGWIIGMGASVQVLASLFTTHIYELSSLFIGLSVFSLPVIVKEEKESLKQSSGLPFFLLGVAVVAAVTYFNPAGGQGVNVEIAHLSPLLAGYIFVCAMIAICAMVLPGISGSSMLLIFGLYMPIIGAIKEVTHLHPAYLPVLMIFGLGVISGIVGIIKIVKNALDNHRSAMVYFILGLMIASLYAIKVGPTTLKVPQPAMSWDTFSVFWFLMGGVFLAALNGLKAFTERKLHPAVAEIEDEAEEIETVREERETIR